MLKKRTILICLFLCLGFSLKAEISLDKFHIITVASKETKGLKQLLASCKRYNIPIEILGLGLPYKGNGQKLTYIKKYLETIPEEDIILFTDAYDTLFMADKQTILNAFLAKEALCIFSGEIAVWYAPELAPRFPESPTVFRYINSGNFISYAGHFKEILERMEPIKENSSDQEQIHRYYVDHQDDIDIDYYTEFFVSLNRVKKKEIKINHDKKNVTCLLTGGTPFIVHGNAGGRDIYQMLYDLFYPR